jgi:hypothetical protein
MDHDMSWTTHLTHLGMAALLGVAGIAAASEAQMYKGYETPPYEVIRSDGAVELREYAPHVVAEVRVRGDRQAAAGRGFRVLASYIFGKNDGGEKVAMTAPVSQLPADPAAETWDVQFMMPAAFGMDSLPVPENPAIRFTRTPGETQAVIRFSGFWTDAKLAAQTDALRAWAAAEGVTLEGAPRFYFYDDPFTLPFNRRNEVAFVVANDRLAGRPAAVD